MDNSAEQLGILIFREPSSNYSYIAETDLDFQIRQFHIFDPRDLILLPIEYEARFEVGNSCPICIVQPSRGFILISLPDLKFDLDNIMARTASPLLRCQLIKLAEVGLAKAIPEFRLLAAELRLSKQEEREFVHAQEADVEGRRKLWSAISEPSAASHRVDREFENWSDARMYGWLMTHYDAEDSGWYLVWNYCNEFRAPTNEFIEAAVKYLGYWASENTLTEVGRVIQRLLKTNLERFPSGRKILFDSIESGFLTNRFFLRTSDTPWWRRIEFFEQLKEFLRGHKSNEYDSFVLNFFLGCNEILISGAEEILSAAVNKLSEAESALYVREFVELFEKHQALGSKHKQEISRLYGWVHKNQSRQVRKRWAAVLRSSGVNPATFAKAFTEGEEWSDNLLE